MAKKGPAYMDCNEKQTSCTRRQAQQASGCPNCEFTIQYKSFRTELDAELRRLKRGTWKGYMKWPSSRLLEIVSEVATSSSKVGEDEIDPDWPVPVLVLVNIYRGEFAKKKSIDNFNMTATTAPATEDADLGDFD